MHPYQTPRAETAGDLPEAEAGALAGANAPTTRRAPRLGTPRWPRLLLSDRKAVLGLAILAFFVAVALIGPLIWQGDPTAADYTAIPQQPPSAAHWLGTDQQDHDIFLQMVAGTRAVLSVAVSIALLSTTLAIAIGMTAGYVGGWVDEILMLLTNIVLVVPSLPLIVVLASYIQVRNDLPIVLVVGLTGWAWGARILRSQTMSLRQKDFVQAAVVRGEARWRIVCYDILPNMISLVASLFIGSALYAIGVTAALYFLGFGNLGETSWFTILYWAQNASALQQGSWWVFAPPGLAIALLGTACALINSGIDEISNPRLRTERVKAPRAAGGSRRSAAVAGQATAR